MKLDLSYRAYTRRDDDRLVEILTRNEWPFHGHTRVSPERALEWIANGAFGGDSVETFLIEAREVAVGLVRVEGLDQAEPSFDLRIAAGWRRRGVGTHATRWITDHYFRSHPDARRFDAQTRHDNWPMRRTLERCGWVKEAHWRRAWRDHATGQWYDSVGYAVLRDDWLSGATTPVKWES